MKRKYELNEGHRFFKKLKPSGESNEDLCRKLILAALSYEGKLRHISSSGYYISDSFAYTKGNDFILNFCDSIGEIPAPIKQAVSEKFTSLKFEMETNQETQVNERPHLSCWELCFLVLKDIGIVSEEQLDNLCYIVFKINEKNPTNDIEITLAHALFKPPLENYRKFSEDSLPSPGDFLLFKKITGSRPYHCAICIDKEGGFIGLDSDYPKKSSCSDLSPLKIDRCSLH